MIRYKRLIKSILFVFPIYMVVIYKFILGYTIKQIIESDNFMTLFVTSFLFMFVYITDSSVNYDKEIKEINEYYQDIRNNILKRNTEENNDKEISDTLELMSLNMKEIKEYYFLSKSMARHSFLLAIIMCILGFIVISFSIASIFIKDITFIESLIPVIGGSIVEVIAGTSLVVYKKSLEQLNQYYEALHNNERYLSLVNLVDKLTDDKKDETYISIINSQLEKLK